MGGKTSGQFDGRHYETGTLHNALRLRGARAPHSGQPHSEALLLGISGGIAFGYFVFEYQGHLPHVALLTRNTFDPFETMLERLAIPREVRQTTSTATGRKNLDEALEGGQAPLVWADRFSLPYTNLTPADGYWAMMPMVVYGREGETFMVADGSRHGWPVPAEALDRARGRVKQERYRVMVLEAPRPEKLRAAVQQGIWQCISLFTQAPPKGARHNFGFAAYAHWAKLLTDTKSKQGWARQFAPGPRMFQALAGSPAQPGAIDWIMTWGTGPDADRGTYAGFLDEAALILDRPGLKEAARHFRRAQKLWRALAEALLPDHCPPLAEARALHLRKRQLFVERGPAGTQERRQIDERLRALAAEMESDFPLDGAEAAALRERAAELVREISAVEQQAVGAMQAGLN
jgi:hypothetical protein